ncbi:hypothetical protein C7212DRAFT_366579 [Tuber magnatum]|uniref:Myb-like DNA-binding domain-containing protein n=1 Tax=Tuber magnatum TaxID=42249 RepID=A0A317SFZ2_9PEZI|nr:hypothetical protein C7212DRAFT_366579 [Tuber magnatum]
MEGLDAVPLLLVFRSALVSVDTACSSVLHRYIFTQQYLSHPNPPMPPKSADKDNSKFLYSVLKQTNTKGVAQENDIPSANAASMRWYRYQVSMNPDGKTLLKNKLDGNDSGETGEGEGTGTKKKRPRKRKAVEPVQGGGVMLYEI